MKKSKLNIVNIILVVVLILFLIVYFKVDTQYNKIIDSYNIKISSQILYIESLKSDNDTIDANLDILNDSIVKLKTLADQYKDSIIKINEDYEVISDEVRFLSDSLTVLKFKSVTSEHGKRFGIDIDR